MLKLISLAVAFVATALAIQPAASFGGAPPALTPGIWANITPPATGFATTFGIAQMTFDPNNPNTLYACIDTLGLWKSRDRGSTWAKIGTLDSPIQVEVDPGNSNHLVATQGVRGKTLGFWVSRDAGNTWAMPSGFATVSAATTNDVTSMSVDPSNFNHILVGSHSPWKGLSNAGVMETKDGGTTWVTHAPDPSWPSGSVGLNFLFDPASKQGDANTWLVMTDGQGTWRTSNAGSTWTKVADFNTPHGGAHLFYATNGTAYSGSTPYPVRSTDNGLTWTQITNGLSFFYYYGIWGDGTTLYAQLSYTGNNAGQGPQPYRTSPESDGSTWTAYHGGTQTFNDGPFMMRYDSINGIMYSANWASGLWALKVQR